MREHWSSETSSEYLLTKVATILQSSSRDEYVSVLRNINMNAASKHGVSLRKPMSGFWFLLNPDFFRLPKKDIFFVDHGREPGSFNLLNPPVATPLVQTHL